jgi:hypothetical protein
LGNGNGNGDSGKRTVDMEAETVKPEDLTPITSKADKPEFWFAFASGSGMRPVSKEVAIHAAATIVNETIGRGLGNQAIVAFKTEPVTVADVLAVIDRLCGGPAGWESAEKSGRGEIVRQPKVRHLSSHPISIAFSTIAEAMRCLSCLERLFK